MNPATESRVRGVPGLSVTFVRHKPPPLQELREEGGEYTFQPSFYTPLGTQQSPILPAAELGMAHKDERVLHLKTQDDILAVLRAKGRLLRNFHKGDTIHVWNRMEKNYSYTLDEAPGKNFAPDFKPRYSPGEMLKMGVFEGKYLNDCLMEFPAEWFLDAIAADKLRPTGPTVDVNFMKADSRLPLSEWKRKGWVASGAGTSGTHHAGILADAAKNPDERGWFQWYCRYWMGRRLPELDAVQIGRWRAFKRHAGGVKANCKPGDMSCRPRQRQALLQWAWSPSI